MSLRTRLFATYTLIVVICLGVAALSVTILLQSYRDRLAMERLDNIARPIYVQVRSLVLSNVSSKELWANLEEQAQKNNVYIILGSNEGNIVRQISPRQLPDRQFIDVPSGALPDNISQPTQGKFVTSDGKTFIFAAYPLGRIAGAVETRVETLILSARKLGQ